MYVNEKMRPVETIPGMSRWRVKENDEGMNSTKTYYKNSRKYQNALPVQQ
jgi:hypothetical protein